MKYLLQLFLIVFVLTSCTSQKEQTESSEQVPEAEAEAESIVETSEQIDHIILAINDLDKGIEEMKTLTGVEPVFGGIHPNTFSQNALISLGNNTYVEILAPRADADSVPEWINKLEKLTPYGWAVSTKNIEATAGKITSLEREVTRLRPGSRDKPDGQTLSWTTFAITDLQTPGIPFLIQWGEGSAHPSTTSPEGCKLGSVSISSSEAEDLETLFSNLGIEVGVISSEDTSLTFKLETPNGEVTFAN